MKYISTILLRWLTLSMWAIIKAEEILKTCSSENQMECPKFAICIKINVSDNENFKCICLEGFQLNPNWQIYENLNNTIIQQDHYCLPFHNATTTENNKLIVYLRSPAKKGHLFIGILLVLLAATLATTILYGLKVLKPIKRSKAIYKKLKNKRQNIIPLQELDELQLNRRYEMQTL